MRVKRRRMEPAIDTTLVGQELLQSWANLKFVVQNMKDYPYHIGSYTSTCIHICVVYLNTEMPTFQEGKEYNRVI